MEIVEEPVGANHRPANDISLSDGEENAPPDSGRPVNDLSLSFLPENDIK